MTSEERAAQLVEEWYDIKACGHKPTRVDEIDNMALASMITIVIRAVVTEAVAGAADRLDEAAAFYKRMALGEKDPNHVTAAALAHEAASIRARSRGEGEGEGKT